MKDLKDYFEPIHFIEIQEAGRYNPNQIGHHITTFPKDEFEMNAIDIFIVGCGERRNAINDQLWSHAPDSVRQSLYNMYDWHTEIKICDLGNISEGATAKDTKAALAEVLKAIHAAGKIAIVIGGSHDLTVQQYQPYKSTEQLIEMATIDMLIDLEESEVQNDRSYLLDLLTEQPNFIQHFSQMGFQSYYTNPTLLQTLDRLRFDCYRLGKVRSQLDEMEPVLRSCDILSIDMNVLRASEARFNSSASPNGLFGDELCQLTRYAGMSAQLKSLGIYGFNETNDLDELGAAQIAQMLWYFVDGYRIRLIEFPLTNTAEFEEYNISLDQILVRFLKSKRTNRWWMELPNQQIIPCSYNDYLTAASNNYPERWFRAQERL